MITEQVACWTGHHAEQRRLCAQMELFADRLPVREVGTRFEPNKALERIRDYEEGILFPALTSMSPQITTVLETFRRHHAIDIAEAGSLVDALANSQSEHDLKIVQARVRALAECLRRHVEFEEAICKALFASKHSGETRRVQ